MLTPAQRDTISTAFRAPVRNTYGMAGMALALVATIAANVTAVGQRREKPSVYLRPIAQQISNRPVRQL